MVSSVQAWPEPIIRVQALSQSGITKIPERFIKLPSERPSLLSADAVAGAFSIPVIDMSDLMCGDKSRRKATLGLIDRACREWGFFQVVNHDVSHDLIKRARQVWRGFFDLSLEEKQVYANSPVTYEGYGSRLGVVKESKLDWNDYFFLHYLPKCLMDQNKWPHLPLSAREVIGEYGDEVVKICKSLMKIISLNLGFKENYLHEAFGGDEIGACLRANFYSKCPQPDLTLGLSSHSDPGALTVLLPDDLVKGLQVRKGPNWITVNSEPNAFIVNIGDQIQIISNGIYKSVEHRVLVNQEKDRLSLALFYNPKGDQVVEPAKEVLEKFRLQPMYPAMTFNEYRAYIRARGPSGKTQVQSLESPR